ncbi:MAG: DNA mismatch repair protein [Ruminococcus sp.]|nr:DNA mismatch repair protein [Ruminococcus sp.]
MGTANGYSILFLTPDRDKFRKLSDTACHDLGLDTICKELTDDKREQDMIMDVLSLMTPDKDTSSYRQHIFSDILALPELRTRMTELFDKLEFIRNFSTANRESDEKIGFWHLMHRLDELNDYISCIEEMRDCLTKADIKSEGLIGFREYITELYNEALFAEMKKDIAELKKKSSSVQSVTLGINVNSRFEAISMGLISVNDKPFKKSGIVSNFADAIASGDQIQSGNEWDGDMHYHPIENKKENSVASFVEKVSGFAAVRSTPLMDGRIRATVINSVQGDDTNNVPFYLDKVLNKMLDQLIRKLRDTLNKYANIAIINISRIIPEFIYYIRFADFIERQMKRGFSFCEAQADKSIPMKAEGFYNLRLAVSLENADDVVCNDLGFDADHTVYILTGANRGGKTTLTQGIGLMFVLAQGGIYVPASSFIYSPADCVYTHFPADEDKTLDLGRLGEECVRFKEIYSECTSDSLLLLNETFSTTSFEEGFYIACDSVKAILKKEVRTIYNTHMHKLSDELGNLNSITDRAKASPLTMLSEDGKRSFKVMVAPSEGLSYARDIAEKYGVTYEMLTKDNS